MNETNLWCIWISIVIISYVAGYATGYFRARRVVEPNRPRELPQPAPPTVELTTNPGPGSERFYNSVDSEKTESDDHDTLIINRMKK